MERIIKRVFFVISTISFFFFLSSFIQEQHFFVRETSHPAYRTSVYHTFGFIIHCGFPAPGAVVRTVIQAFIAWKAYKLPWPFNVLLIAVDHFYLSTKKDPFYKESVCSKLLLIPYQMQKVWIHPIHIQKLTIFHALPLWLQEGNGLSETLAIGMFTQEP
ncbi:ABC transporter G family member STR2-like [Gossypium raimondii]|nr:ABC transporter G family member STR2-like [Gossypium raimondii]